MSEYGENQDEFSLFQLKVIAVIPMITGTLSIIGSSLIIYMSLRSLRKNSRLTKSSKMYYRLLLGMSAMDILQSTAQAFSSLPMPKETKNVYGAIGNETTCVVQAFIGVLGCAVPMYNGSLAIYYLLTVRFNVKDEILRRKVEPFLHFFSLCYPLVVAILGLVFDMYGPENAYICQISPSSDTFQNHEDNSTKIRNYFIMLIVFSTFFLIFIVLVCMGMVTFSVLLPPKSQASKLGQTNKISNKIAEESSVIYQGAQRLEKRCYYDDNTKRSVMIQAGLYALFCVLTLFFAVLDSILVMTQDSRVFAVTVSTKIFFPLQGFFNYFVFVRPRVNRLLQSTSMTFLRALYTSTFRSSSPHTDKRKFKNDHKKNGGISPSSSGNNFSDMLKCDNSSSSNAAVSDNAVASVIYDENVTEENDYKYTTLKLNQLPVITEYELEGSVQKV